MVSLAVNVPGPVAAARLAALALLVARARDGVGGQAEVGLADALRAFAAPLAYGATTPDGPLGGARPTYALYAAAEGWVAVAALEAHFAARLAEALGVPLTRDALAAAFRARPAADWAAWAEARDLPIAAVVALPGFPSSVDGERNRGR